MDTTFMLCLQQQPLIFLVVCLFAFWLRDVPLASADAIIEMGHSVANVCGLMRWPDDKNWRSTLHASQPPLKETPCICDIRRAGVPRVQARRSHEQQNKTWFWRFRRGYWSSRRFWYACDTAAFANATLDARSLSRTVSRQLMYCIYEDLAIRSEAVWISFETKNAYGLSVSRHHFLNCLNLNDGMCAVCIKTENSTFTTTNLNGSTPKKYYYIYEYETRRKAKHTGSRAVTAVVNKKKWKERRWERHETQ